MLGDGTYLSICPSHFDIKSVCTPPPPAPSPPKNLVNPWISNAFTGDRNATSLQTIMAVW